MPLFYGRGVPSQPQTPNLKPQTSDLKPKKSQTRKPDRARHLPQQLFVVQACLEGVEGLEGGEGALPHPQTQSHLAVVSSAGRLT